MISIRIKNFDRYKGRPDVQHNSWFRCSNRILEDHEFFAFSHEERLVWIYFLCLASQKNTASIHVSHQHAHQVVGLSAPAVDSAIKKLKEIGCIEIPRTRTVRGRYVDGTRTCATDRQTDRERESKVDEPLPPLALLWNEYCEPLPEVVKTNAKRNKKCESLWKENTPEQWVEIIRRIATSDFCQGKSERGWRATFDWLLQPDTYLKVIEGKYDTPGSVSRKPDDFTALQKLQELMENE